MERETEMFIVLDSDNRMVAAFQEPYWANDYVREHGLFSALRVVTIKEARRLLGAA
jgi:hypothetical protein